MMWPVIAAGALCLVGMAAPAAANPLAALMAAWAVADQVNGYVADAERVGYLLACMDYARSEGELAATVRLKPMAMPPSPAMVAARTTMATECQDWPSGGILSLAEWGIGQAVSVRTAKVQRATASLRAAARLPTLPVPVKKIDHPGWAEKSTGAADAFPFPPRYSARPR